MTDPLQSIESTLEGVNWKRGIFALGIALLGAVILMIWLAISPELNMPGAGYFQSWVGGYFRIAGAAYGGYWICRGLLRIDLSQVASRFDDKTVEQAIAVGCAQLARALVVGCTIIAASLMT